jgi:hypothetical protein
LRPEIQPKCIAGLLGGNVRIEPFPVPHDCFDEADITPGLQQLQADLRSGTWDNRHDALY